MASYSSSYQQNQEFNTFSGIDTAGRRRRVSESSKLYDVFINHRGPDVKQTLAIQLYNSLEQVGIRAFLDSEEKELGNSFPSIIETAIRSASVHIAIFSRGYAQSPWCLAELVLMLQTQAKIIPVFNEVKPWELHHIEKGVYNDAFINYQEKGRYLDNLPLWKEALQSLSFIAGEEFNSFSDCKNIVVAVQKEVPRKNKLHVAKYPVGLDNLVKDFERQCFDELVQDFQNQCVLQKRRDKAKANVVGIFGMGGVGKTTLAKELFNRKKSDYYKSCILFDVREASVTSQLPSLQVKLLKDLFDQDHCTFTSTEEGTSNLKDCLQRSPLRNFLIVVDDIDHVEQLDALQVTDILDKFGNILVIVTTRDVGVLIAGGITLGYRLNGLSSYYGRQLFCWHAFGQPQPCSGYEELVEGFLNVCGGLPLSLQVLGRHVRGRAQSYWRLELIKVSKTLPRDVKNRLKISFDALDSNEKQVLMDIACFFVGKRKSIADRVWEVWGWNAQHALETLKDKCLVSIENVHHYDFLNHEMPEFIFRMHDHVRDLGREMALELAPPHRLWRPQDLDLIGFKQFLQKFCTKTNARCYHSIMDDSMDCRVTFFLGQSDICVETSASLLWLQLEGNHKEQLSVPSWIPLHNLQCLKIKDGRFKTLWKNCIQEPSNLKELMISGTSLKEFPDFSRILDGSVKSPKIGLEKLQIKGENCLSKILISGIHCASLQSIKLHLIENLTEVDLTIVRTLNCLDITNCKKLKVLKGMSDLTNLVLLNITRCPDLEFEYLCLRGMKFLKTITFDSDVKVKYFELDDCQILKTIEFGHEKLVKFSIRDCPQFENLSGFSDLSFLKSITVDGCGDLWYVQFSHCLNLKSISGHLKLRELHISDCPQLEELPTLSRESFLKRIEIDSCKKLQNISLPTTVTNLSVQHCRDLQRVAVNGNLRAFRQLRIIDCPKLKELSALPKKC